MVSHLNAFASAVALPAALLAGAAQAQTRHDQTGTILSETGGFVQTVSGRHSAAYPESRKRASPPYGILAFCHFLDAAETKRYGQQKFDISHRPLRKECRPLPDKAPTSFTIDTHFIEGRANLYTLRFVNNYVKQTPPKSDLENYGVSEFWDYPNGYADCEDYALLNRYILSYLGEYLRAKQTKGFKQLDLIAGLVERGMDADYMQKLVRKFDAMGADLKLMTKNTITAGALRFAAVLDEQQEGHAILIGKTHQKRDIALDNKTDVLYWKDLPYYTPKAISSAHNVRVWREAAP